MRTPAEQAIYRAECLIYDAADRLEKSLGLLAQLRALITPRLPLADAESEMDETEDHLDVLRSKLGAALAIHVTEIERLQDAEAARYLAANSNTPQREAA